MRPSDDTTPLFVRLPSATARKLDAAAAARGASKRQLVTELLGQGLLGGAAAMDYGHASVISGPAEVLTLEEAAELLQVEADALRELAESGQLPARRIGTAWRVSRSALLAWLGAEDIATGPSGGGGGRRRSRLGFAGDALSEAPTDPQNQE